MGSRGAQQFRIVGAVDVNIAAPGIGVVRFQSVQPQNAGQAEPAFPLETGQWSRIFPDFSSTSSWRGRLMRMEGEAMTGEGVKDVATPVAPSGQ